MGWRGLKYISINVTMEDKETDKEEEDCEIVEI